MVDVHLYRKWSMPACRGTSSSPESRVIMIIAIIDYEMSYHLYHFFDLRKEELVLFRLTRLILLLRTGMSMLAEDTSSSHSDCEVKALSTLASPWHNAQPSRLLVPLMHPSQLMITLFYLILAVLAFIRIRSFLKTAKVVFCIGIITYV